MGAAISIATLTSLIPGKWKWATGSAAVASAAAGMMLGGKQDRSNAMGLALDRDGKKHQRLYADTLEKSPELREQLAHYIPSYMASEHLLQPGVDMESAVREAAGIFALKNSMQIKSLAHQGESQSQAMAH